ncbi:MAG: ATP-binding protein, partial [Anaerolineales bacterium]
QQVTDILSQPYGSMVYHMLVSFILISVLYPALGFNLSNQTIKSKRILIGLGLLIASRIILFIFSAISSQNIDTLGLALPVIDRVVIALNLSIIVWLWVFEEPNRLGDFSAIIICILILIAGIASAIYWNAEGIVDTFNDSILALGWDIFSAFILIAGLRLLISKSSQERNTALTMIVIIILGVCLQMIVKNENNDYPTLVRLAFIAAFPLMLGLAKRFQEPILESQMIVTSPPQSIDPFEPPEFRETQESQTREEKKTPALVSKGVELKLFQTTMALVSIDDPTEIFRLITLYIAHAMVSDLCFLLSPPDEYDQIRLICGYDLITQESIASSSFSNGLIPGYANAVEDNSPLHIPRSSSKHMIPLADLLRLEELGDMLIFPFTDSNNIPLASIALISPYSKYIWSTDDQNYLQDSKSFIASAVERALYGVQPDSQDMNQINELREKLQAAEAKSTTFKNELAAVIEQDAQQIKERGDVEQLKRSYESAQETIEELRYENQSLQQNLEQVIIENQALINTPGEDYSKYEEDLAQALGRASTLQAELDSANQIITKFEEKLVSGETLTSEQAEIIASIAQELRQPMSSITGYTDLLISESVGILGELQRKFLDRVRASIDRMNHLISDLIQITTLEAGNLAISPKSVDLTEVIDEAIEMTSTQIRDKNILLRVDISQELPEMLSDKDALLQIVLHLLQNAGAATPQEGEITLIAEFSTALDDEIIEIKVTDSGEGIPKEELPRVFSRLYRADNPLIQGVGDTGVGLSIAKTLTEALGGRIWVESEPGTGSTFSLILPVAAELVDSSGG